MNELMKEVFVEQPPALPGSALKTKPSILFNILTYKLIPPKIIKLIVKKNTLNLDAIMFYF